MMRVRRSLQNPETASPDVVALPTWARIDSDGLLHAAGEQVGGRDPAFPFFSEGLDF